MGGQRLARGVKQQVTRADHAPANDESLGVEHGAQSSRAVVGRRYDPGLVGVVEDDADQTPERRVAELAS